MHARVNKLVYGSINDVNAAVWMKVVMNEDVQHISNQVKQAAFEKYFTRHY